MISQIDEDIVVLPFHESIQQFYDADQDWFFEDLLVEGVEGAGFDQGAAGADQVCFVEFQDQVDEDLGQGYGGLHPWPDLGDELAVHVGFELALHFYAVL